MKGTIDTYLPEDVLLGIFYLLPDNTKTFVHDLEKTCRFFQDRIENYSILENVNSRLYDRLGTESINQALINLMAAGHIEPYDKSRSLQISPTCISSFEKYSKRLFNSDEMNELERLSHDFQKEFLPE